MPKRPQITLNKEELERADIPMNHVLVKIVRSAEGLKTKGGVTIGFLTDEVFAEGDDSHSANLAEIHGVVAKVPQRLFFDKDDPNTMDWETEMELQVGDTVWYSLMEAKNSVQILCEGEVYKSIPYADIYVAKREEEITGMTATTKRDIERLLYSTKPIYNKKIIVLNGYVLCKPVYFKKTSEFDISSEAKIDKTRGVIAFIGNPVTAYLRDEYNHIEDLRVGDEVMFDAKTPLFYLERLSYTATFDEGNQYWCTQRRRISLVLNR